MSKSTFVSVWTCYGVRVLSTLFCLLVSWRPLPGALVSVGAKMLISEFLLTFEDDSVLPLLLVPAVSIR